MKQCSSWAALDSDLVVLYGTKNFKWPQRSRISQSWATTATSLQWSSAWQTVRWLLLRVDSCFAAQHQGASVNRNHTPGEQYHRLPGRPGQESVQVFLATPPCSTQASKVRCRSYTMKLLRGQCQDESQRLDLETNESDEPRVTLCWFLGTWFL